MITVLTINNSPESWYQDTYICLECDTEFMTKGKIIPRFCPCCGVKFDALRITYHAEKGHGMQTVFLRDPQEVIENE